MPIPASCPMCGSSRDQFKFSRKTGRAKCPTCGEIFEPDEDYESSALPPPTRRFGDDAPRRRPGGRAAAEARVKGPAIYMIVVGVAALLVTVAAVGMMLLALVTVPDAEWGPDEKTLMQVRLALSPIGLIVNAIILFGGFKMLKLESLALAQTAAAFCAIPCCNGCSLLGSPGGIWALVVLNDQEVKDAFR